MREVGLHVVGKYILGLIWLFFQTERWKEAKEVSPLTPAADQLGGEGGSLASSGPPQQRLRQDVQVCLRLKKLFEHQNRIFLYCSVTHSLFLSLCPSLRLLVVSIDLEGERETLG